MVDRVDAKAAQSSSGAKQVSIVAEGAAAEAVLGIAAVTSASNSQAQVRTKYGLLSRRIEIMYCGEPVGNESPCYSVLLLSLKSFKNR